MCCYCPFHFLYFYIGGGKHRKCDDDVHLVVLSQIQHVERVHIKSGVEQSRVE